MGTYSEKEAMGRLEGSLGIKCEEPFKKAGFNQGRKLFMGEGVLCQPIHSPHHPPFHPPIGIINTLLWQTGVSVLFQVVADPSIGIHVLLIAQCTWL